MSKDFKILVAEDNLVNQMVISKILKKMGLQVDLAKNGLEATDMALQESYDLILMDMQMPVRDGLEATLEIRKIYQKIPIIVALTANAASEDRDKCLEAGMNDFLSKPISKLQLTQLLNKWFEGVVPPEEAL